YESRLNFNNTDVAPLVEGLLNIPYSFSISSAQAALVSIQTGDEECPVSYRWILLNQNGYTVSPPFGSCSEQIQVAVKGKTLLMQTPNSQRRDKIDLYAYDGKT